MIPTKPGWYWYLPDARSPTPTGLLRLDTPVVLLVSGKPEYLCVHFPRADYYVEEMYGDWAWIEPPEFIQEIVKRRTES